MKAPLLLMAAALLAAAFARPAHGQAGLESAGGTTSLVATDFSALTIDAAETSLTLLLQRGVFGVLNTHESNFRVKLSADDGERALFSEGRWVPGLELEERLVRVWNDPAHGGYTAAFLSLGYEVNGNSLARTGTGSVIEDYEATGQTGKVGLGFNWAPNATGFVLGISATGGRGFNVPVARRASQVCTQQAAGTNEDGAPVFVSSCSNRYLGEVHDTWTGEFRVDMRSPHILLPVGKAARAEQDRLTRQLDAALGLSAGMRTWDARSDSITAWGTRASDALKPLQDEIGKRRVELAQAQRDAQGGDAGALQNLTLAELRLQIAEQREQEAQTRLREARRLRDLLDQSVEVVSNTPTLSFLASASTEVADGAKPIHSVAAGPMLHPPFTPLKVIAGVLFELDDLTNATGDAPDWEDRFAIRLYIGVPF